MSTEHTPGPWYAKATGCAGQALVIDENTGRNVAVAYDENDMNLLAAAPDLLAALELVVSQHDATDCLGPTVAADARAAIAKAKGE